MRWLSLFPVLVVLGCSEAPTTDDPIEAGRAYATDPAARRASLEGPLANAQNGYSATRLASYREDVWGALPVWTPRVRPVNEADIGESQAAMAGTDWAGLSHEDVAWEEDALAELGRVAFLRYPVQVAPFFRGALEAVGGPARYGLRQEPDGAVGGLVWVELARGTEVACTCSTCHADTGPDGGLVPGKPNRGFDLGRLRDDFHGRRSDARRWGPGRVDVTPDRTFNPTSIPDLRPVRHQTHLHHAATVRNDLVALAIRIETLLITSTGQTRRPPRKVAFAMALYLWRLADSLPELPAGPGRRVFEARCAGCHTLPDLSGAPVPLGVVGTDPTVAQSPARGTGTWRVPSLRGVGDRTPLLASGSVPDLEALLDPARQVPGHTFGHDLGATDRAALLVFLRAL